MRRMYSLNQLKEIADERVEALVEGGTLSNAKPLYWHGLELGNSDYTTKFYFNPHILNNSPNKIDTIDKFIAWAKSITGNVTVSGNGVYTTEGVSYPMIMLRKTASGWALLYTKSDTGWVYVALANDDALKAVFNTCADETNKIN